eukprot:TRINITY_DN5840_c0_g1_i1.p1 TRINITY_DN5840_c0_g1~~TRINITY_DN5840_c0_g1_i1.p1  ORF type:complete len:1194 (+),score=336.49 TRINITY_DN5840_c0_g1_i1:26-3607(+)
MSELLTDELKDKLTVNDSDILAYDKPEDKPKEKQQPPAKKKLTKKQQKRLDTLKAKREKEKRRKSLFEELGRIQLEEKNNSLMHSSRDIGLGAATKKMKLNRALLEEQQGVTRSDPSVSVFTEREIITDVDAEMPAEVTFSFPTIPKAMPRQKKVLTQRTRRKKRDMKKYIFSLMDEDSESGSNEVLSFDSEETDSEEEPATKKRKISENIFEPKYHVVDTFLDTNFTEETKESIEKSELRKATNLIKQKRRDLENSYKNRLYQMLESGEIETNDKMDEGETETTKVDDADNLHKYYRVINRTPEITEQRMSLPIIMEEHNIMEKISENDIVIICGQTGSGKTTQVPQFLYEAGYGAEDGPYPGLIGCTQPRRVAAVSMSNRVAVEMNVVDQGVVSHQIRYESTVSKETQIKFMTDGILLREIQSDFLLRKYSAILIDEAHERSLNTDILLGLLSRIVPLRRKIYEENKNVPDEEKIIKCPLKLVIMSATLRVEDFTKNERMFPVPPPLISVDSRQYPVTVKWNKQTPDTKQFVKAAFTKVCKIHTQLPPGGILVFLTGREEIDRLCRKLKAKFEGGIEHAKKAAPVEKKISLDKFSENSEMEVDNEKEKKDEEKTATEETNEYEASHGHSQVKMKVLPLYSMLDPDEQMKIFEDVPEDTRLVVVATNIAETSITINNITYVVDSGRVKNKHYEQNSGMEYFSVDFISKASADQRAGRAGRVGPGYCFRLFSSAVFSDHFSDYSEPEILRTPIESVVLQMKKMGIDNIISFPFPTPPSIESIERAEQSLFYLGALHKKNERLAITTLGKALVNYPISPRYGKMLLLGEQGGCLEYTIAIVAALTVGDPFLRFNFNFRDEKGNVDKAEELAQKEKALKMKKRREQWINPNSDLITWMNAIGAYEYDGRTDQFCKDHYLHVKTLSEIHALREQLTGLISAIVGDLEFNSLLEVPTREQKILMRQIIAAGFVDQVARRVPEIDPVTGKVRPNRYKYITVLSNSECYIHNNSVLYESSPQYIVYQKALGSTDGERTYLIGNTAMMSKWLTELGKPLCNYSEPLQIPGPKYNEKMDSIRCFVRPTYGPYNWELEHAEIDFPKGIEKIKYFARFLLEGKILPTFLKFQEIYSSSPALITKQHPNEKILRLIQPLINRKIDTKGKLKKQWKRDKNFLLEPMLIWVKKSEAETVKSAWPPM